MHALGVSVQSIELALLRLNHDLSQPSTPPHTLDQPQMSKI